MFGEVLCGHRPAVGERMPTSNGQCPVAVIDRWSGGEVWLVDGEPADQDIDQDLITARRGDLVAGHFPYAGAAVVVLSAGPRCDAAPIACVISLVVSFGYRSGPRWLMALADCGAAEVLGAF
jgi:hypothetical protein